MFTKNWYKMIYGCSADVTLADVGMTNVYGQVETSNTKMGSLWYCGTRFGVNSGSYPSPCMYRAYFMLPHSINSYGGVFFGDGSTPPTADDYILSGNFITTATASSAVTKSADETGVTITGTYTITNTGTEDITIAEVGLFESTNNNGCRYMMERTVLDSPVTIEPGGVGQVTYTIRMNYPT